MLATTIPSKMSVTKIKEIKMEREHLNDEFKFKINTKPMFLNQTETLSKAEKGTIMHLCLQKLDIRYDYSKKDIEDFVWSLVNKQLITEKEAESVDINKLYSFTKSDIWNKMKTAKVLERERPFYINIEAKEIYEEDSNEKVLVQGIIDAYFISQDGKVTLVDYKTDYVHNNDENDLKEKYHSQLELYKVALENALKKNVDEIYIYSTYLNKEIRL